MWHIVVLDFQSFYLFKRKDFQSFFSFQNCVKKISCLFLGK